MPTLWLLGTIESLLLCEQWRGSQAIRRLRQADRSLGMRSAASLRRVAHDVGARITIQEVSAPLLT